VIKVSRSLWEKLRGINRDVNDEGIDFDLRHPYDIIHEDAFWDRLEPTDIPQIGLAIEKRRRMLRLGIAPEEIILMVGVFAEETMMVATFSALAGDTFVMDNRYSCVRPIHDVNAQWLFCQQNGVFGPVWGTVWQ